MSDRQHLHHLADAISRWREGLPHRGHASSLDRAIGPRPFTKPDGSFNWTGAASPGELQPHQLGPLATIHPNHPQYERIERAISRLRELAHLADEDHPMDGGESVGDLFSESGAIVADLRRLADVKDEPAITTTTPSDERIAMRPKEAAKLLGIGERKLWELTNRGEIPHAKAGRAVVYSVDALKHWLNNGKGTP